MKKLTALVMLLVMALCCCTAQADGTMKKFQPYTDVKMDVLEVRVYNEELRRFCFYGGIAAVDRHD